MDEQETKGLSQSLQEQLKVSAYREFFKRYLTKLFVLTNIEVFKFEKLDEEPNSSNYQKSESFKNISFGNQGVTSSQNKGMKYIRKPMSKTLSVSNMFDFKNCHI